MSSSDDDVPRPKSGAGGGQYPMHPTDQAIRQLQQQTDETVVLMRDNVEKTIERGEKLEELEERTEVLVVEAEQFKTTARKVEKKYWWKNKKWTLIIVAIVIGVVIIIILSVVLSLRPWEK